jgi:hypothetical protein
MANLGRTVLLAVPLAITLAPIAAEAGRERGGGEGGGGGRLGQVSAGLGSATGGGSSGGGASTPRPTQTEEWRDHRYARVEYYEPVPVLVPTVGGAAVEGPPSPPSPVRVDFYAGAQKVYESDGSLSLELAFNQGRFRLGGALSRYFERQPDADALTFTLASLYLGFRIDDGGPTRVFLEAGAVGARTRNDPVMSSSVGGLLGGVRVEHAVSRRTAIIGAAHAMAFEQDVRAGALRAGLRVGHLEASLRYLDLNVGPALFGPEVGLSF